MNPLDLILDLIEDIRKHWEARHGFDDRAWWYDKMELFIGPTETIAADARAELAELRRDRERLEWWFHNREDWWLVYTPTDRDSHIAGIPADSKGEWWAERVEYPRDDLGMGEPEQHNWLGPFSTFRAAIDAAMKEEPE